MLIVFFLSNIYTQIYRQEFMMGTLAKTREKWIRRKKRIRKNLSGSEDRPRLSVFRSAKHIYGQVIDDTTGRTLACASSVEKLIREQPVFDNKVALASFVGELLAERAMKVGIKRVVFDRNGFLYHGRVRALSQATRKAGLDF